MNKKRTKKWLELLFSNADIHTYHVKVIVLIKKIIIYMDSQRLAHKAEVNQLHQEIDKLTNDVINEKMMHAGTQKLLDHAYITLDDKNESIIFLKQRLSDYDQNLFDECDHVQQLKAQKTNLYKTLGLIHNRISNRKKRIRIRDYEMMLTEICTSIEEVLPNHRQKE
jgi:hypothetical protein